MLQARPKGTNDPFYAPHRDVAYLFPHLCAAAMRGLDAGNWEPWYKEWLDYHGLKEADLGDGAVKLALFTTQAAAEAEHQTVQHVLEHVGYFDLPKPVQFVISAKLGQMLMGAYFRSIREVTHADEAPPMDVKAVLDAGVETARYMSMGRFRRTLVRKLDKARRKLVSWLTGKKEPDPQLPKGPMPLGGQHLPEGGPSAQTNTDPGKWEEPALPDNLPKPGNNPEGL
jgi:hypothetical protein